MTMVWHGFVRAFHTQSCREAKTVAKNLKGKSRSSQDWLVRQLADPYVEKAKILNYRCRSAFKLIEIDQKYKIIKPGNVVVDCGAAPGSWSQVAVSKSNSNGSIAKTPKGLVVGVDLLQIYPIEGAHTFGNTDFTTDNGQNKIRTVLESRKADCVLSDMAPNATGVRSLDQELITELCYAVLRFAIQISTDNASLLVKVWDNGEVAKLERDMQKFYRHIKAIKPNSSRGDSSEHFILARGFFGLKTS